MKTAKKQYLALTKRRNMSEMFTFPRATIDRKKMVMYRSPVPDWNEEQVKRLASRFRVEGRLRDRGDRFIVEDENSMFEVFRGSHSIWWTDIATLRNPPSPLAQDDILSKEEATRRALSYLETYNQQDNRAALEAISQGMMATIKPSPSAPNTDAKPFSIVANFGFSLDRLPIFGPGAKMQVTFGAGKQVTEFYKFWREPIEDHERELLPIEAAIDMFRRDEAFVDLRQDEARVTINSIQLGYYAFPPRENQGYLVPIYAFDCVVSTPHLESYEFTDYVVAVPFERDEIKMRRVYEHGSSGVF
jgi:hypothetical protein